MKSLGQLAARSVLLAAVFSVSAVYAEESAFPEAQKSTTEGTNSPQPPFTISKETTYLIEPLMKDGYVDYVAALSKIRSEGVTPENNAVVPILRAIGPEEIPENIRGRFFRMLGIEPLPEKGDYLIGFGDYRKKSKDQKAETPTPEDVAQEQKEMDQFWKVVEEPWSAEKYPLYAAWLQANQEPLEKIREATRRPKFYSPILAEGDNQPLVNCLALGLEGQWRTCARYLMDDAMFSIGQGNGENAQRDILACHRLGRLVGQGPSLVNALVAFAIDGLACSGDRTLARSHIMNAAQMASFQKELRRLPPLPKMADKIDVAERFLYLDWVALIARQGPGSLNDLFVIPDQKPNKMLMSQFSAISSAEIDWDTVLRMGNSWYDRMAKAGRKPTRAERADAWKKIDDEFKVMSAENKSEKSLKPSPLAGQALRTATAKKMGSVLICFMASTLKDARHSEDRHQVDNDFSQLVLALDIYHSKQGAYPAALADLAPNVSPNCRKTAFLMPTMFIAGKETAISCIASATTIKMTAANRGITIRRTRKGTISSFARRKRRNSQIKPAPTSRELTKGGKATRVKV